MSRPDSAESRNDLKRLYENVQYYKKIGGQYDTSKPEKLVASFVKIAEEAVQKAGKKLSEPGNTNETSTFDANAEIPNPVLPADHEHGSADVLYSQPSPLPAAPYRSTVVDTEQTDMSFLQHVNWLEHSSFDREGLPIDIPQGLESWASGSTQPAQDTIESQYNSNMVMMDDFMNWAGHQAKQQPMDMYFDWLSWDGQ